jgi:hypothetical protein
VHRELLETQLRLDAASHDEATTEAAAAATASEADMAERLYLAQRQRVDPDGKRPGSLPLAIFAAIVFAVLDVGPARWAAEALGSSLRDTRIVTLLLVAGLAGFAVLLSHFKHGHVPVRDGRRRRNWSLWFALAASAALVVIESKLRYDFLRVTEGDNRMSAGFESGLLALVTAGLLWMSYVVLLRAEPVELFILRRRRNRLAAAAEARREEASLATARRLNEGRVAAGIANAQPERFQDLAQWLAKEAGKTGANGGRPTPELQAALPVTDVSQGADQPRPDAQA